MTSISGSMSPSDRIQQMLQSAVTSGTVKTADQGALSGAITDIDTALQSGGPSSTALTPSSMKSKVDGLVDQEVKDGKLTSDQADELKQLFAKATQGAGHHHGHHVKASGDSSAIDDITSTDTDPTSLTATGTSASSSSTGSSNTDSLTASIENLITALKQLETATSSATNYTASGTSAGSLTQNLLVNATA
ncbi:polyhydroxyalkanoate synthesis regulator phasin [Sphingomonas vulcanisoli]|uniref:Polyhydroxyalkanoate synthesis regulator phasin n=1 Tax=Sphingomonas vulcanisoli TaxID=1658060 RepID=A0ABX0TYZ0_9SPHN|nr:hypothetical protein [Sphingomonas vulcanisoli]NIJ08965.1 polyhydroxyalkanoate synthesis regulator phasin [Sphingomonas vulcanisoli]